MDHERTLSIAQSARFKDSAGTADHDLSFSAVMVNSSQAMHK
jgi:hypothetical protein